MSMIVRGMEEAIKKGQSSVQENINKLIAQNDIMIDNQNEMITLMMKIVNCQNIICKKLGIDFFLEANAEDPNPKPFPSIKGDNNAQ